MAAVGNSLHFRVFVGDRNVVMETDGKGSWRNMKNKLKS